MSQIFYLSHSFYFMKSRKLGLKKWQKVTLFLYKIKTRTKIKILRHGSLQMDITNKVPTLQGCSYDSKSEISVQKIKVKKTVFNLFFV